MTEREQRRRDAMPIDTNVMHRLESRRIPFPIECCLETELLLKGASAGTLLWAVKYLLGPGASLMRDVHVLIIGKDFPWNDDKKAEIKDALVQLVQVCPRLSFVDAQESPKIDAAAMVLSAVGLGQGETKLCFFVWNFRGRKSLEASLIERLEANRSVLDQEACAMYVVSDRSQKSLRAAYEIAPHRDPSSKFHDEDFRLFVGPVWYAKDLVHMAGYFYRQGS